jgi:hypothetical protein
MTKKFLAIIAVAAVAAPFLKGNMAVGSIRIPASLESPQAAPAPATKEKKPSLVSRIKSSLARFRPVAKENAYLNQDSLADRRTIDEVFDEDMSGRLEQRYRENVAPLERDALNPYRRASFWETERYEQSRKDLAQWTLKEVGKDQLKEFERRARGNSGAFNAVASVASSTEIKMEAGNKQETNTAGLTEKERILRAHQMGAPVEEEEPSIPTRLRAKLNVIKARGQLTFSNPVVTTMVEGGAGSGENLAVEMNRDFHSLEMNSKVRYGVDESVVNFVVNKKITEEVSVDLNSQRWTGSKRGGAGEKKRDTAKVVYSISF